VASVLRFTTALSLSLLFALAACSRSNDPSRQPSADPTETVTRSASSGAKVYNNTCATCHQTDGQGLPDAVPPLAGNPVETGDTKRLIHIVKYGLTGSIQVKGHTYNGTMPAWAQQLSDSDIANVITYERSSWGNRASAVTASDVSHVSK
jgi:mono/diheme cytochrome c family protein